VHQRSNADRFSRDVASPVKGDATQDGPRREAGDPLSVLDFTPERLLKSEQHKLDFATDYVTNNEKLKLQPNKKSV
jgi:hypothetical protein